MVWTKEVEMVDSLEELQSSRSVCGKNFPKFEMLDAKIAAALNKIIQNPQASVTLREDDVQESDTRWDEVLLSMSKIPSDDVLESLYTLRIRESDQLKTVLEMGEMEIHRKISMPNYQKLKTMVKRSINQKLRLRIFDARHGKIETGGVVKSRKGGSGC